MASAIVLCAGLGTRLRPLTDELPKPLVPVGDRSILEHALGQLHAAGFSELVVNAHHLASLFEPVLARFHARVQLVVEGAEIRGTAGGVAGARPHFSAGPVLVWNGDILVEPPLTALLQAVRPEGFCLGVAPRDRGAGTVGLDSSGRVVRLRGERFGEEAEGGDYVGVLALGADALARLPEHGCLFGDAALPFLRAGGVVQSVAVTRPWTDAGDAAGLLRANQAWLEERGLDAYLGDVVELPAGIELRGTVVGAGARLSGAGRLEGSLVCAGASASAPLFDAIVAPSGRVIQSHA